MTKNKITLILVLVIIITVFGYFSFNYLQKSSVTLKKETVDLCIDFPEVKGEISCQKAKEVALEKYPGEVYSVNKTETPPLLEDQDSTEKFWVVGINLDEPIEKELPVGSFSTKAEVFINIHAGFISVVGFN